MKTRKLLTVVIAILAFAVSNVQAQTLPSYVPTNGLVGYWGFNGNANDQSGNGNNGTVNGATLTTDRFGNLDSAYSFDGVSNWINITNSTLITNNQMSISCWFKYNGGNDGNIISTGNQNDYLIHQTNSDAVNTFIHTDGTSPSVISMINNNSDNWNNLIITYDGVILKTYVNGILSGFSNASGNVYSWQPDNLTFGVYTLNGNPYISSTNQFYNGKIDDIAIYNRALTQQEITQLYSATSSTQNLCTKTIQPYNVNVGDATHDGSTYAWSITPAAPNAVIAGNGNNTITIDWTNVPDGSYTLQAIETSIEGCVSTAVTATINLAATTAPIAQPQTFCNNATVANLTATGTNLNWFASANDGAALANSTSLTTGTYYASQTVNGCESTRIPVSIIVTPATMYYADVDGDGYGNPYITLNDCSQPTGYVSNWKIRSN